MIAVCTLFFRKKCLNTAIFSYIPSWNNLTDEILWNKKKVKATVVVKGEYWVVQPGSIISPIDGQGLSSSLRNTRKSANIKDNVLQEEVTFTSPSLAAGFVTGHSTDGWENWRDKDGDLIDEYRQK